MRVLYVTVCLFLSWGVCAQSPQQQQVPFWGMVTATTKSYEKDGKVIYIWWQPRAELYKLMATSPGKSNVDPELKKVLDQTLSHLDAYVLVAINAYRVKDNEHVYYTEEELRKSTTLQFEKGPAQTPCNKKDLPEETAEVFDWFVKMFHRLLPALKGRYQFFLFKGVDQNGQYMANPARSGLLSIKVDNFEATWKLPLQIFVDFEAEQTAKKHKEEPKTEDKASDFKEPPLGEHEIPLEMD